MRYPVDQFETKWYDANPFGNPQSYGFHEGSDINLKTGGNSDEGHPIYAVADGICSSVHLHNTSNNFGRHTHIEHDGAWGRVWTHYAHCSDIYIKEGERVKEGQLIARVGRTGTVYSHLHFAIKLQPTGIDGIARTKDDLKKWTDPIVFIKKWMREPQPEPGNTMIDQEVANLLTKYGIDPNKPILDRIKDLDNKLNDHVGTNWGLEQSGGGYLGDARRRIKVLESQTTTEFKQQIETAGSRWEINGIQITKGDETANYKKI